MTGSEHRCPRFLMFAPSPGRVMIVMIVNGKTLVQSLRTACTLLYIKNKDKKKWKVHRSSSNSIELLPDFLANPFEIIPSSSQHALNTAGTARHSKQTFFLTSGDMMLLL